MDAASDLRHYLPVSFKSAKEEEYLEFLWEAFDTNLTHKKFQFAFLAYHMLTMSFVYFNIWQIRQTDADGFEKGVIGFGKDMEKILLAATSPFVFSAVNERSVLRLLKLIACDNGKIGTYTKLVEDRNDTAHSNGNIFFNTKEQLDEKISEVLRVVEEIQEHSRPIIVRCYRDFLLKSTDPDEREYADPKDQIREELVHGHYLSEKDVAICLAYDISAHSDHQRFGNIKELHEVLRTEYPELVPAAVA